MVEVSQLLQDFVAYVSISLSCSVNNGCNPRKSREKGAMELGYLEDLVPEKYGRSSIGPVMEFKESPVNRDYLQSETAIISVNAQDKSGRLSRR